MDTRANLTQFYYKRLHRETIKNNLRLRLRRIFRDDTRTWFEMRLGQQFVTDVGVETEHMCISQCWLVCLVDNDEHISSSSKIIIHKWCPRLRLHARIHYCIYFTNLTIRRQSVLFSSLHYALKLCIFKLDKNVHLDLLIYLIILLSCFLLGMQWSQSWETA